MLTDRSSDSNDCNDVLKVCTSTIIVVGVTAASLKSFLSILEKLSMPILNIRSSHSQFAFFSFRQNEVRIKPCFKLYVCSEKKKKPPRIIKKFFFRFAHRQGSLLISNNKVINYWEVNVYVYVHVHVHRFT